MPFRERPFLPGIISALDADHNERIENIWQEFTAIFGHSNRFDIPHFTYHQAHTYDITATADVLAHIAAETPPFTVRTTGLGIFTGERPTLYIPVLRTTLLLKLQQRIVSAVQPHAEETPDDHYHNDLWQPHITLAVLDTHKQSLPEMVKLLGARQFNWEVTIDNLTYLPGSDAGSHPVRYNLAGGA